MIVKPASPEAFKLFHEGALALANVEANGIRVDIPYLNKALRKTERKIARIEERLREDRIYKTWRKAYGDKTNLAAGDQLAHVLFTILKHPCSVWNAGGKPSSSEANLIDLNLQFTKDFTYLGKLRIARAKLKEIQREVASDGVIHPFFNLSGGAGEDVKSGPKSYRSASDRPNFQNYHVRFEELAKLVRQCFIPHDNESEIIESDFSGIEVGIAACYTLDPVLIDYVKHSPPKDMHRDMAMRIFGLSQEQVSKPIRHCAKNKFVFPEFYGSWWRDCSQSIWDAIPRDNLVLPDGTSLRQHLKTIGIKKLGEASTDDPPRKGTFQHHVKQQEDYFWNDMFRVYTRWKKEAWEDYQRTGMFRYHTGFVVSGHYDRKQVINYRIQGSAFHCLLWVLIRLDKWLRKNNMRSKIIGQIHDSIVASVHRSEREAYIAKIRQLMTVDLPKAWPWIVVPLNVEIEAAPEGMSWYHKEKVA